jgi:hypothetical protein
LEFKKFPLKYKRKPHRSILVLGTSKFVVLLHNLFIPTLKIDPPSCSQYSRALKLIAHVCPGAPASTLLGIMAIEVATLDALEGGLLLLEPMLLEYLALVMLAILPSEPDLLLLVGQ